MTWQRSSELLFILIILFGEIHFFLICYFCFSTAVDTQDMHRVIFGRQTQRHISFCSMCTLDKLKYDKDTDKYWLSNWVMGELNKLSRRGVSASTIDLFKETFDKFLSRKNWRCCAYCDSHIYQLPSARPLTCMLLNVSTQTRINQLVPVRLLTSNTLLNDSILTLPYKQTPIWHTHYLHPLNWPYTNSRVSKLAYTLKR